jgi:hypothetical protein
MIEKRMLAAALSALTILLCSCTYYDVDPFLTETERQPDSTGAVTGNNTQQEGAIIYLNTVCPDDDFYGLSVSEAVEKYGMLAPMMSTCPEDTFDGKYTYFISGRDVDGEYEMTLYRHEFPNGNVSSPVCTDPLCTHTEKSGCPLAGLKGATVMLYGDKIFFTRNDFSVYSVYMYDIKTNKTKLLVEDVSNAHLFRTGDTLYLYYNTIIWKNRFEWDIDATKIIAKISGDGTVTELKRLKDYHSQNMTVYDERYVITYENVISDNGGKVVLYSLDILTDEETVAAEFECPGAVKINGVSFNMFFGSKLLLHFNYHTHIPNTDPDDDRSAVWLTDVMTKEKWLICTPDHYTYKQTVNYMCSKKCILWQSPRFTESEPLIIHIYFPYDDKEVTHNISDMIKAATGEEEIPLGTCYIGSSNSALWFININETPVRKTYEVDLENGNVYKYDVPQ